MSFADRPTASGPVRPADLPVLTPQDALGVLLAGDAGNPAVMCLLLDAGRRGLACLEVAGSADTDAVLDVAELLLSAVEDEPAVGYVVLGSRRATHRPQPGETELFVQLRDQFEDAGLVLVDWFLLAGRRATSMAELTGTDDPWQLD
jgi:hypothetical protein